MDQNEITVFQRSIETCEDPAEIARKVKLVFKRMPGEMALACFANVMTAALPHPIKVAVWDAVRYSHIWWGVDDVLSGNVMDNPLVRRAFADAVPMRRRAVELRLDGWEDMLPTLSGHELDELLPESSGISRRQSLIAALVRGEDIVLAEVLRAEFDVSEVRDFIDARGNGILWYLTFREDQQAIAGFACPNMARVLIDMGADPNHRNDLGLCWNDVASHFIPAP